MPAARRTPAARHHFTTLHRSPLSALALAALAALMGPGAVAPADAAACSWQPASGNWADAANWSCAIVPSGGNSDSASIASGRIATIDDLDAASNFRSIYTLVNGGTLRLDAYGLSLTGGGSTTNSGTINVGGASTAALQVLGGHNIANAGGTIAIGAGSVLNQFGSTISGGTISSSGSGRLVAFNSGSSFLDGVTLNGTLDMASGQGVERITSGLVLNGRIDIGANSVLAPQGDQTFSGSGSIVFADANGSNRFNLEAGNLVLASGITVRGHTGTIGGQNFIGGTSTLTNNGTIQADVAGGTITLAVNGGITNNGTLAARNGGTLLLNSNVSNSSGSQIVASSGGTVVQNGVALNGAVNVASGAIAVSGSGSNFFNGVSFSGVLDLASSYGVERVAGGLTLNNAQVRIGANSIFAPQGDQTISGTGSIVFADANGSNRFNVEAGKLVLGSGITLRGHTGTVGGQNFVGGAATLTNYGTIQADVAGGIITLAVNGGITNNGTLAARNGGTLLLNTPISNTAGSQIVAADGGTVVQNGVTLNGSINVASGAIVVSGSGSNFFDGVSFAGTLDLASGYGVERVVNGLTLNGSVNIGANSIFAPQGDQAIGGTGTIVFADANGSNRFNVEAGNLVLGSGITLRGHTGTVGAQSFVGGSATLTNNGVIQADVAGGTITLAVTGGITNNGTLAARNGGTLLLNTNIRNNEGSQIVAGTGSTVLQNGVTLNGVIQVSGGGTFTPSGSGSNFLDAASFSGVLDMASAYGVERITGGLSLNGTVRIGSNSIFAPQGDQTLTGSGSIVFADSNGSNRFNVEAGNLVLDSGITVRGGNGSIGGQSFVGGTATLFNKGLISADVAGTGITLAVNGLTTNTGTLQATGGGTLALNSAVLNSSGTVRAEAASVVTQNGVSITGGLLATAGSGRIAPNGDGNNFISGVTLGGTLDLATNYGVERVVGGLVLDGTVRIGANSIFAPQGDQTFSGNGSIVFADGNGSNRFNLEGGNLVLGSGVTVRGNTGYIGGQNFIGGSATLLNRGTIQADVGGGTITMNVNGLMTNSGTLRASNGGTLLITTGSNTVASTGVVEALADSAVRIASNASFSNLAGGTLTGGIWKASSVGGGAGLIDFAGNNTSIASNAADIVLIGPASTIQTRDAGNVVQTLDQTLASNLGALRIQQGRVFTASASGGNFVNGSGGLLELSDGSFVATTLALTGTGSTLSSFGSSSVSTGSAISGNGQVMVQGGTLILARGFVLDSGSLASIAAGATLNLASATGASTVATLSDSGALALGTQNLNVTKDYVNAAFGVGNGFNARAGVGGSGLIVGVGASQTLSGAVSSSGSNTWLLNLGNVRGGTAKSASFQVLNNGNGADIRGALQTTALSDARLSGSGTVAGNFGPLAAGSSSGSYTVTMTANAGGALSGQSLAVVSNFGNVATQTIDLAGFASALAVGNATPQGSPVVLGNFRVGGSAPTQAFAVQDLTTGAGAERLGIASVATTGNFSASNNLGAGFVSPGASFANAVAAAVSGGVAGINSGSLTINYSTNGQLIDSSFTTQAANSQNLALQATGYLAAAGLAAPSPVQLAAQRVGGTASVALLVSNTTSAGLFSEDLNASFGAVTGAALASGSVTGRVAGTSNTGSGSLLVGLDTATSGSKSGSVTVNYQTAGTVNGVSNGLGTAAAGSQTLAVSGKVYAPAVAQTVTGSVDFGIVRVGEVVAVRGVTVANAASGALTDTLRAALSGGSAPFGTSGSVGGLAAGASNGGALTVALNTASAGVFNGSAAVAYTSQNPDMADLALASGSVTLHAQVNNLAASTLSQSGGAGSFSGSAASYTLNFGTLALGAGSSSATLSLTNSASGPADALGGSFDLGGLSGGTFVLSGFGGFSGLAAGSSIGGLTVSFSTATAGSFDQLVVLNRVSSNASEADLALSSVQLHLQGSVVAVPEPGTWALWLGGLALLAGLARRRGLAARD